MKTDILKKESDKRNYISPVIECIKLDNEISLILNSFDALPGDPFGDGCDYNTNQQLPDATWE